MASAPTFEMTPNPDFAFPMLTRPLDAGNPEVPTRDPGRRPSPLQISTRDSSDTGHSHRRTASTLPNFSFNSTDVSGLTESTTPPPPRTPDEIPGTLTPSRRGHRRGASEFVGGDSRLGVAEAVSTSPTKSLNVLSIPPPSPARTGRRGHAHRRSAALSSHDLGSIMHPTEPLPRSSSSLPTTPLETPDFTGSTQSSPKDLERASGIEDPFGPILEETTARPPSRPRVGFSENVEYIPRPLSTISSETECSLSTIRGHSGNNSISSVLSLGTPSPPTARGARLMLGTTPEDEAPALRLRSSIEINRRSDKDVAEVEVPVTNAAPASPSLGPSESSPAISFVDSPVRPRESKKRRSLSQALGFDRRRSEPLISNKVEEPSRLSAISLPGPATGDNDARLGERPSSAQKLRAWAASKMQRKVKEVRRSESAYSPAARPATANPAGLFSPPRQVEVSQAAPVAETDLDAVFASQGVEPTANLGASSQQPHFEISMPANIQPSFTQLRDLDDRAPMLDLDAALGPFKTPPLGSHRHRREMHSSRSAKDFGGPSTMYSSHRRAESAPALAPFEFSARPPPQASMADVFEEEDEEENEDESSVEASSVQQRSTAGLQGQEVGIGIQIVDSDGGLQGSNLDWGVGEASQARNEDWEDGQPTISPTTIPQRLITSQADRRVSLVDETIVEEASPIEAVQIVTADEEPRSSSLTKSSDSSETPTIIETTTFSPPESSRSLMTPDTFPGSIFPSPEFSRRPGSFETSRLGTSGSSITDNRTMSSYTTGEHGTEGRISVDDVPSLTSSRSTMISASHVGLRRDAHADRPPSVASISQAEERRRKRSSIQSLSQLMGGSFGPMTRQFDTLRPQTANPSPEEPKRKEHRLKKLMFWKSRNMSHPPLQPEQEP